MSAEPYYSDEFVTLYHGDCLDVLPTLSGVDCVVTSPPYNTLTGSTVRGGGILHEHPEWSYERGWLLHRETA